MAIPGGLNRVNNDRFKCYAFEERWATRRDRSHDATCFEKSRETRRVATCMVGAGAPTYPIQDEGEETSPPRFPGIHLRRTVHLLLGLGSATVHEEIEENDANNSRCSSKAKYPGNAKGTLYNSTG